MNLRRLATILNGIALAGLVTVLHAASTILLQRQFSSLERQSMERSLHQAKDALAAELSALDSKTGDWANWDDAYQFVAGEFPEFVARNVTEDTFAQLRIHVMAFVDPAGGLVLTRAADLAGPKAAVFPESLTTLLRTDDRLRQHHDTASRLTGLLFLPQGTLLVASRPILNTHGDGPIHGTLIFGRFLDEELARELEETTHLTLHWQRLDQPDRSPATVSARTVLAAGATTHIQPLDAELVAGVAPVNAIDGTPGMLVTVTQPRDVYQQGKATLRYFLVVLIGVALVFGVTIQLVVNRLFLSQLARERTEAALRLRERAIEAVEQGIVITDPTQPDNPVVYVNPGFEKLTGYRREEILGHSCRLLRGAETDPAAIAKLREAVQEGRSCLVELLNYRKDGTTFWNSLVVSPIRDSTGELTHFVGVQTDVTEIKNLGEQLRESQKMEAIGRLAGGVAHDFNNILTAIMGYCQLSLERSFRTDPIYTNLEEINAAAGRAASLTGQLLAFSRRQILSQKIIDLNQIVAQMDRMLRRLIGEDIELVSRPDSALGCAKADPGQIEQVLLNLAVNARDAMPRGGRLTIATANVTLDEHYARQRAEVVAGDYIMLAVTDTGCGMTAETQARVFEPFFTTKEPGKGTGLGLATCFGIAKQSGGHIAVYSELGIGTTFKVYLPRVNGVAEPVGKSPESSQPPRAAQAGETVLLVEDEPAVRAVASVTLRGLGYTVLAAGHGKDALRIVEQRNGAGIDLLLTDVVMPQMGGRELADALLAKRPELKVLFSSGYTEDAIVDHGVLQPGIAFIQKPYSPTVLARKIREVLDGSHPASG